jgi:NADP-dependent 3-hydroxy acid dehydrogenase YdfG
MGQLEGKVVLITGAARGQGRSHAVRLASEGANIIAVDICETFDSMNYALATADDLALTEKLVEETGQDAMVALLARDESRYVTGLNLRVDAGAMLKGNDSPW